MAVFGQKLLDLKTGSGGHSKPGSPPKDVAPATLFRGLCASPRAFAHCGRCEPLGNQKLSVRAATGLEFHTLLSACPEPTGDWVICSLMAATMCDTSLGLHFTSAQMVSDLMDPVRLRSVYDFIEPHVLRISPLYGLSDYDAWMGALTEGVRDVSNQGLLWAMGQCFDTSDGRRRERPDQFFGIPMCEVTDGQWMAYRAAKKVYLEETESKK